MVGRIWEWWRGHAPLVDAGFLLPVVLLTAIQTSDLTHDVPVAGYAALSVGLLLPLVWRRRWPVPTFCIVALVSLVQWCFHVTLIPANFVVLVGLYTVTAYTTPWRGLAALGTAQLGALMEVLQVWTGGWKDIEGPLLFFAVVNFGVWILGLHIRTRREYLRSVEDRAARLERERENELRMARAGERSRIARELHDVVAHNVSVMVVQADGASYTLDTDPARARQALTAISETGRTALGEMRRLLGVLRADDDVSVYAPQPGLAQLGDLVDQVRHAGLPVDVQASGEPPSLAEGRQLTIYRVVQEALTNTLKHGGPEATARVRLGYGPDEVRVEISDDGRGAAASDDGRGHGLPGMRERVGVYGGEVRAGPRVGGGFEVVARIPVREDAVMSGKGVR
ncbi:Sensor histidine kinase DesK [Actinomadura rubteroloni]|uniref:histidine kinase n=1 Tax=Actinomadura rubteroloni TaxID=1926885 RepID=A0A2P4UL47_9ACTN|nr:sensor histidine kinase [Actinomadura rubteroloni]POM25773.1 Sensor histidine kinase DesK [Actinomadura rubteroloni]